eukprot:1360090-Amphidinium_carterae.2
MIVFYPYMSPILILCGCNAEDVSSAQPMACHKCVQCREVIDFPNCGPVTIGDLARASCDCDNHSGELCSVAGCRIERLHSVEVLDLVRSELRQIPTKDGMAYDLLGIQLLNPKCTRLSGPGCTQGLCGQQSKGDW